MVLMFCLGLGFGWLCPSPSGLFRERVRREQGIGLIMTDPMGGCSKKSQESPKNLTGRYFDVGPLPPARFRTIR
jgi:hypothetical protein